MVTQTETAHVMGHTPKVYRTGIEMGSKAMITANTNQRQECIVVKNLLAEQKTWEPPITAETGPAA